MRRQKVITRRRSAVVTSRDATMTQADDARVRRIWQERVRPELRVPCSLHMTDRLVGRDNMGCCWRDDSGRFHVAILPGMPFQLAVCLLIHELAHLDGISAESIKHDDHGSVWGAAYSHWYQIVMRTA